MFMDSGTAYVYSIYGMYWCFNISSLEPGSAVLIRSIEPLQNKEYMLQFRIAKRKENSKPLKELDLCNGPSKLCQAFQIDKNNFNQKDLSNCDNLWLEDGEDIVESSVVKCKRIGIDSCGPEWSEKPLRFYVLHNKFCYIGETGRSIRTRLSEHSRNIRANDRKSLLCQQITEFRHSFNLDSAVCVYKGVGNKIDTIFDRFGGRRYFTKIDLKDSFWQLKSSQNCILDAEDFLYQLVGELKAVEADQDVPFHLRQLVDDALAQLGFRCLEELLLGEVWAELQLSCAHGVRYKERNLQKGQYSCRYFFKENHCRNFVLVSKDTCNNRECQVIVNGGSSSRQTKGMVIGLKRAGWSIRQIAADTHLGAYTVQVHRLWRRWLEQGNVAIYRNVGATRVTSARVDRRILRRAVAAPQATCTATLQHVQDTLDHSISTRTISRRLVANGLHSCRPLRRLPLTPPNRRQCLEWCRARSTWMTEWHRVVFSDESRFCLSSDSRRVRVWRRRGERSNPAAIVERATVRQRGMMVWGAIAYDSRSPLLRIQGTMTAQRYVDDVLRPVTLPYLQGVPNALYQQDNARPHTARISQQALQDVQMLPWPLYSPDLSPIEHVWDIIGRRLHALPQPRSEDELWQMVEREWRAIPQDAICTLIDSLPRRVAACIAVRGGPTCY
ncbi:MPG [Cordylochernes scorpioides]|uniref:DNA-3-methyladenine glycosylase II n=1 Tax=Cordylochernes scorpioides TaxID=51811 RepID=A0ABY6LU75_9ARAC|nr:MPG [Cordylochernes scorpioides]